MATRAVIKSPYLDPSESVFYWNPVIYWILLVPMLFFAANGSWSFLGASTNNGISGFQAIAETDSGGGHKAISMGCYLIVLAALFFNRKRLFRTCTQNWLILALPLLAILSIAWSQFPKITVLYAFYIAVDTLFAVYLVSRFRPEQQMSLFLLTGAFALVISIGEAILYPAGGVDLKEGSRAWEGMYSHKNIAAMLTLLFLIPIFCVPMKTAAQRAFRMVYTLLSLGFIVMTTARTGWLQTAIVLLAVAGIRMLRKFPSRERNTLIFALVPVIIICIVGATVAYPYLAVLMGKDPTMTGRTIIWAACIRSALKRPFFGYGFFAFWVELHGEAANTAMAAGDVNLGNAENGVLQLWLELGLVGLAILTAMVVKTCRNALHVAFRKDAPGYVDWYIALLVFTLLSVVDGSKFLLPHSLYWMMYLIADLGLAAAARQTATPEAILHEADRKELSAA
jgi:exopolysaccharide production protein ExoQ